MAADAQQEPVPAADVTRIVAAALDQAYLGQLSDVGRAVLLDERRPKPVAPEPEPEPELPEQPFFAVTLPAPGWHTLKAKVSALGALGDSRLVGAPIPNMAGEDFAFFLSRKRGAFFFIGSNPLASFAMDPAVPVQEEEAEHGDRRVVAHHTPEFDLHEGCLAVGISVWVALAMRRLSA